MVDHYWLTSAPFAAQVSRQDGQHRLIIGDRKETTVGSQGSGLGVRGQHPSRRLPRPLHWQPRRLPMTSLRNRGGSLGGSRLTSCRLTLSTSLRRLSLRRCVRVQLSRRYLRLDGTRKELDRRIRGRGCVLMRRGEGLGRIGRARVKRFRQGRGPSTKRMLIRLFRPRCGNQRPSLRPPVRCPHGDPVRSPMTIKAPT